jgi:hypothetical protein
MANYTVKRIQYDPGTPAPMSCVEGEQPVKVLVEDLDTGTISTAWACQLVGDTDPCYILNQLVTAGFTPNDWTTECP